jgi:hypothetical protein
MEPFDDLRNFPDHAIRNLLKDLRNLEELLREVIPQQVAALDLARAALADRDFLLPDWRERSADLFFEVPLRLPVTDLHVLVCVLLEHQTAADPCMPLRMFLFGAWYWEREWKRWETAHPRGQPLRLPPIIPIVLHTGATPWHTNRRLSDLIATPPLFRPFSPDWEVHFYDLADHSPQELLAASSALLEALAVVRAERAEVAEFQGILAEALRRVTATAGQERVRWSELVRFMLSWAARRRPHQEQAELRALVEAEVRNRPLPEEVLPMSQQVFQTNEEYLRQQGALHNSRQLLQALLQDRFQQVSPELLRRIELEENLDRLRECIRQVHKVTSPEELHL